MTAAEEDVISDIAARIQDLLVSLDAGVAAIRPLPEDGPALDAKLPIEKLVASGFLKTVEQLEDQLARLFRTILTANDIDIKGMFARDFADYMEQLGIVDDAAQWMAIVKMRNRLVHDYPVKSDARRARLVEAADAAPFIATTALNALAYLANKGLLT